MTSEYEFRLKERTWGCLQTLLLNSRSPQTSQHLPSPALLQDLLQLLPLQSLCFVAALRTGVPLDGKMIDKA